MRQRMAHAMRDWATRRLERRLVKEWKSYDHRPNLRMNLFRRDATRDTERNTRPWVQLNFYRHPRR
jgi:hypothetical protein